MNHPSGIWFSCTVISLVSSPHRAFVGPPSRSPPPTTKAPPAPGWPPVVHATVPYVGKMAALLHENVLHHLRNPKAIPAVQLLAGLALTVIWAGVALQRMAVAGSGAVILPLSLPGPSLAQAKSLYIVNCHCELPNTGCSFAASVVPVGIRGCLRPMCQQSLACFQFFSHAFPDSTQPSTARKGGKVWTSLDMISELCTDRVHDFHCASLFMMKIYCEKCNIIN